MSRLNLCRFAVFAGILLSTISAQAEERITSFFDTVSVAADGGLTVSETLVVTVTGEQIVHGIYRDLPTEHSDGNGNWINVRFEVTHVLRDGQPEHFIVQSVAGGERIKIGDPNVVVEHGVHNYEIAYRTDRTLYIGNGAGALYWNVTGNGWAFTIDEAASAVTLPAGTRITLADFFTGPVGATDKNGEAAPPSDRSAKFRTTSPLGPGEGMTILVCFTFQGDGRQWTAAIRDSDEVVQQLCGSRAASRAQTRISRT